MAKLNEALPKLHDAFDDLDEKRSGDDRWKAVLDSLDKGDN